MPSYKFFKNKLVVSIIQIFVVKSLNKGLAAN